LIWRLKKTARIQGGVAKKLEDSPMERVCSRFDGSIDDRSPAPAKLSRVVTRLDFEFLDCVDVRSQNITGVVIRVIVDTVQHEVVQIASGPVHRKCAAGISVRGARGDIDPSAIFGNLDRSGGERCQLRVIAAIEWKRSDLAAVYYVAKG